MYINNAKSLPQFELWMFATTDELDIIVWQENMYHPNGEMCILSKSFMHCIAMHVHYAKTQSYRQWQLFLMCFMFVDCLGEVCTPIQTMTDQCNSTAHSNEIEKFLSIKLAGKGKLDLKICTDLI